MTWRGAAHHVRHTYLDRCAHVSRTTLDPSHYVGSWILDSGSWILNPTAGSVDVWPSAPGQQYKVMSGCSTLLPCPAQCRCLGPHVHRVGYNPYTNQRLAQLVTMR